MSRMNEGIVVQGRYVVHELLARGGMAEVYRADDTRLGVAVALKTSTAGEASAISAFEREARLLAGLRHAGLPHVTDLFREHGQSCMVMQLIAGDSLEQVIARGGYSLADIARWAAGLLDVVAYLHGRRPPLIHGDIKPHNIVLAPDGGVVLLDLGVAGEAGRPAAVAGIAGFSAAYAAPEQLRGEPVSPATDLFAVGATLYQLATGRAPVDAQTRLQVRAERRVDPLRPVHELVPHAPAALATLVSQLVELDAARRPDSAVRVSEQLRTLTAGATVVAMVPAPKPAQRPTLHVPRYETLRPLGEGGMGQVFVARDRERGIEVCLKRLQQTIATSSLRQECAAIARLQHPGIVRLFDYQLEGDDRYMVLELVAGPTLSAYLARHAPVSPPVAVELARRLLDAIAYAHEHEVIHCDLKPDNVLVVRSGAELVPKVLDFGLAIVDRVDDRGAKTGAGRIAGTPLYMAPEQFRGEAVSGACDVYAIGLMIAELLVGALPFQATESLGELAAAKARPFGVEDLARRVPGLPAAIGHALQHATARDPRQRPSARELLAALDRALPPVRPPQVWAPVTPSPGAAGGPPPGWFNSLGVVGGASLDYDCAAEASGATAGSAVLRIASTDRVGPADFGSVMQRVPAWHLIGARLELSGYVATESVEDEAALWIRVDSGDQPLMFDNMAGRGLRGTTPWTRCTIGFDVPAGAEWLNYGLLLSGRGVARAAELRLDVVFHDHRRPLTLWRDDAGG
jgi:serine/threonine protein kinase